MICKRFICISLAAFSIALIGFLISLVYLKKVSTDNRLPETKEGEVLNIKVSSPKSGGTFNLPIKVEGEARVFENVVSLKVVDEEDNLLFQDFFMASSSDVGQFGPFSYNITTLLSEPVSEKIFIKIYWDSPKDGSPLDEITIPVVLGDKNLKVASYFGKKPESGDDCQKVFPLYRLIAKTESIGGRALTILLSGLLTEKEKAAGYFSSLPEGAKLISLNIKNGTAYADFDGGLDEKIGGSCRVSAIRSQIESTLKQFSSVKKVVISVNGETESALQP